MSLRPYQQECLEAIRKAAQGPGRHLLAVLPTGGGKTVVFSHLPEALDMKPGERLLVLVHREELAFQACEKLQKYNPSLRVDIEKAEYHASDTADIVVASVQTIGRNKKREDGTWEWCERIRKLDPNSFRFIVIDEAHHAVSPIYCGIMRFFRVYKPEPEYDDPNKLLLLVTATPERGDNIGLELIADRIVYSRELREMIEEGWLCDVKAYRVDTSVDISTVKTTHGDFATRELEKTVNVPERNRVIVSKYKELGEGQRFLGFTVDIQHSEDLSREFNDAGVRTFALSCRTPDVTRRKVIQLFREGYYRGILSAGVLIEGFDDPGAMVGLMCCPTKSGLKYRQSVGRVLRPFPAPEEVAALKAIHKEPAWKKPHAVVLDFCDLSGRHRLSCIPSLFGLKPEFDLKGKPAVKALAEMERIVAAKKLPVSPSEFTSVEDLKAHAERIDLFAKPSIPDIAKQYSSLAWVGGGMGLYHLCLPDYVMLKIGQNTLGQWEVHRSVKGVRTVLSAHKDLAAAFRAADSHVPPDQRVALNSSALWRNNEPTPKQCQLLWRCRRDLRQGLTYDQFERIVAERYTRGEVSTLISQSLTPRDMARFSQHRA